MSNCLPFLVASLPALIIICGLIALFCIVLFDTTPGHGQTKTVKKFREPGKIEHAPQEDIEFDTDDLLVKVEKEISPDSNVVGSSILLLLLLLLLHLLYHNDQF